MEATTVVSWLDRSVDVGASQAKSFVTWAGVASSSLLIRGILLIRRIRSLNSMALSGASGLAG